MTLRLSLNQYDWVVIVAGYPSENYAEFGLYIPDSFYGQAYGKMHLTHDYLSGS